MSTVRLTSADALVIEIEDGAVSVDPEGNEVRVMIGSAGDAAAALLLAQQADTRATTALGTAVSAAMAAAFAASPAIRAFCSTFWAAARVLRAAVAVAPLTVPWWRRPEPPWPP